MATYSVAMNKFTKAARTFIWLPSEPWWATAAQSNGTRAACCQARFCNACLARPREVCRAGLWLRVAVDGGKAISPEPRRSHSLVGSADGRARLQRLALCQGKRVPQAVRRESAQTKCNPQDSAVALAWNQIYKAVIPLTGMTL